MSSPKSFYILYGWTEGKWHARRLIAALEGAGYHSAADVTSAHLVIAHSAGCYMVPSEAKSAVVLLVGVPYWPGKTLVGRLASKVKRDAASPYYTPLSWLHKLCWNTVYLITKPASTIRLWRAWRENKPPRLLERALVIRNDDDSFCTPDIDQYVNNKVVRLPGQHDDIWLNPDPYMRLARSYDI